MFDTGSGGAIQDAVKTGKVRLIATLDRKENVTDSLDHVIPGLINVGWFGLSLPPGSSPEIVKFYLDALNTQLADGAFRARLGQIMVQPVRSTSPAQFMRTIEDDTRHFEPISHLLR
jgi:tripartite-type tricarboxylate transporter receptor subunit TctC